MSPHSWRSILEEMKSWLLLAVRYISCTCQHLPAHRISLARVHTSYILILVPIWTNYYSGKDATEDFEDVGHSDDAKEMMEKYFIGEVDVSTIPVQKKFRSQTSTVTHTHDESSSLMKILQFLVPLLILGFAFGLQFLGKKEKAEN